MPWEGVPPLEVWERVKKGERILIPRHCPPLFRSLIVSCWSPDPEERPTWSQILDKIKILRKSLAENKKQAQLNLDGRTFVVDDPEYLKMTSARMCTDFSDHSLLSSLPPYVVPARMVSVHFSSLDEGIKAYLEMAEMSLERRVSVDLSLVLRDKLGKMHHIFLYDKTKLRHSDNLLTTSTGLVEDQDFEVKMEDRIKKAAQCACTSFVYHNLEAVVLPIDPRVRHTVVCHVSLREDMKTVASMVYVKHLAPWAMKRGKWKGGITLTHYNHGKVILVNFFLSEEDRDEFMSDGSYFHVLQQLSTFLLEVPVVEYFSVHDLMVKRDNWFLGAKKGK